MSIKHTIFQLSGLEDVVFNDFIKNGFILEGGRQVESGSQCIPGLPGPVDSETV